MQKRLVKPRITRVSGDTPNTANTSFPTPPAIDERIKRVNLQNPCPNGTLPYPAVEPGEVWHGTPSGSCVFMFCTAV